jgi:hypothetical protein
MGFYGVDWIHLIQDRDQTRALRTRCWESQLSGSPDGLSSMKSLPHRKHYVSATNPNRLLLFIVRTIRNT